ncbi:lysine--tRNA ligase [Ruminococcus sp. AM29-19LB]|nr:lysine--tRNA ligase [Ruminococcus sp. AF19-4LB]RGH70778.1 lysine--tRNA ligase [Ruminococcus sp. AM29-5AC]RGH74409.1 lysine--tRNA ligase [Ruminococcus sp. AM29-1LB]RGH76527.1 lysine--tRNA ligase [Ruminococcus sp. AM29-19LB]RGH77578.1 lysine--tRNA ligase [Ruminococcus sp. AM29-10LB]RGH78597.1 lysine--tRNA ligase [Ruminococcus sp. AM29-1]
MNQLRKVRREKLAELQQNGRDPFQITKFNQTHHSLEVKDLYEAHEAELLKDHQQPNVEGMDEEQAKEALKNDYEERRSIMDASPIHVAIAGRMMFKRVMGKASFCNIQDLQGNIQVYVARDAIGTDAYADFKKSDIGDIFGLEGFAFRTRTGEISIHAEKMTLLSKSLQMLPEKFHGLTDTDTRYRQRYVDLIMNADSKDTFIKRSKILAAIRKYLSGEGFMEVETPMLVANAGGAAARPFETHFNALNEDLKLRISLELYLKRLIVGGLEKVYEIGRVFRNEGLDTRHNPEFTLMELYQAYTDYHGMMDLTENMYRFVAQEVLGTTQIVYKGIPMDLGKPFERITMVDAVKKYAGVDWNEVETLEQARELAKEHNVEFEERHKKGDILNLFFEEFVEEHLLQPTFVMDHPVEISPLTKKKPENPEYVERFEFFMNGWEMANAYSELNDPIDQRERFKAQEELLAQGDDEANTTDEDFMNALEIGMPPTGGIGFGIDRMCMLLTGAEAIRDVLLFPTMKSMGAAKNEANNAAQSTPVAAKVVVPVEETAAPAKVEIDFSNVEVEPLFEDMVDFDTFSKSDFRAVKVKECEAVPKSKKLLKFVLDDGSGVDRVILSGIHDYYEPEFLVGKTLLAITNLPPRKMMGIDSCGMIISATHLVEGREGLNVLILDDQIPAGAKLY